jgi:hypothetical protein
VSQAALDYVQGSAAVKALPAAEKLVLRQLAMLHNLQVNCAFAFISDIATLSLIGGKDPERQCRRILQRLEKKGFILRHTSVRNNGSQTSNEYELLGLKAGMAVTEQMRQQMFTTPRTRVAAQLSLSLGDGAVVDGKERDANGSESSAVAGETPNRGDSLAVENDDEVSSLPRTPRCPPPPGRSGVSALDVVLEASKEVIPPYAPPAVPACAKSKSANQEQEQRTTASAKAKATTPVMRSAEVSMERGGEAGMSFGRVIPFRRRRDAEAERAQLDGFEAALFDVTMVVLGECGIAPKNVTRRQRIAVSEALRNEAERSGENLSALGAYAINRWDEYLKSAWALWRVVGVRQFFAEGYWLEQSGHPWDWDKAALAERRNRGNAGIGMR